MENGKLHNLTGRYWSVRLYSELAASGSTSYYCNLVKLEVDYNMYLGHFGQFNRLERIFSLESSSGDCSQIKL